MAESLSLDFKCTTRKETVSAMETFSRKKRLKTNWNETSGCWAPEEFKTESWKFFRLEFIDSIDKDPDQKFRKVGNCGTHLDDTKDVASLKVKI